MRKLPTEILKQDYNTKSLEAQSVIKKYSQPKADIGEEVVDHVALSYMTPEAVLYWLPHFFNFIENKAKPDSLHFELIRQHFVDESWVRDIKEYATPQELKTIQTFIQWFGQQPYMDMDNPLLLATFNYMVALWNNY